MPWKQCPACSQWSYSAATHHDYWECPYCRADLTDEPFKPFEGPAASGSAGADGPAPGSAAGEAAVAAAGSEGSKGARAGGDGKTARKFDLRWLWNLF